MVKTSFSRMIQLGLIVSALLISAYGQSNTPAGKDRSSQKTNTNQATSQSQSEPLMQLAEMNVAERDLGKVAAKKAQNRQVKDFANMMVRDHTQGLAKVHAAQGAPATEPKPNAKHQQAADKLSKLTGAEFDRAYMDEMVNGHQEAVNTLQEMSRGNDAAAKIATELLPTVKQHLQKAQEIQKELQSGTRTTSR